MINVMKRLRGEEPERFASPEQPKPTRRPTALEFHNAARKAAGLPALKTLDEIL
jgi:hypothetical protein